MRVNRQLFQSPAGFALGGAPASAEVQINRVVRQAHWNLVEDLDLKPSGCAPDSRLVKSYRDSELCGRVRNGGPDGIIVLLQLQRLPGYAVEASLKLQVSQIGRGKPAGDESQQGQNGDCGGYPPNGWFHL